MIRNTNKMQLQILYYIRQADKISFSDLCKRLSLSKNFLRNSSGKMLLYYLLDLHNNNFINISINNEKANNIAGQADTAKGTCVRTMLGSALRRYSLSDNEQYSDETNPNDIMIAITDYFYTVQRTIGFSISSEIEQAEKAYGCVSIFGEIDPSLKSNVFVIMPFAEERKPIYEDHIELICQELGLTCRRVDQVNKPDVIINDIWSLINNSDLIICDCTDQKANVFYELGVAHALGKKVMCITQNEKDIPFDIERIRYIKYDYTPRGMKEFETRLKKYLIECRVNN